MSRFRKILPILLFPLLTACPANKGGGDNTQGGGTTTNGGGGGGGVTTGGASAGQTYFTTTVKPAFQAKCTSCHGFPAQGGNGTGPLTLWNYNNMRGKLLSGGIADNELIDYARGSDAHVAHPGGDYCAGNLGTSPCLELLAWCDKEGCSPSGGGGGNNNPFGKLDRVSNRGLVEGYAKDVDTPNTAVNVEIYADGVRGSGSFLGSVVANRSYVSVDASGNIGFQFQLPAGYIDNNSHTYYLYAQDSQAGATYAQLVQSPKTKITYSERANAKSFYDTNVLPKLNANCGGCHGTFTFNTMVYDYFLSSSGTPAGATTHSLYQKISGAVSHGGGNRCSGANDPCPGLVTTYNTEFP